MLCREAMSSFAMKFCIPLLAISIRSEWPKVCTIIFAVRWKC